MILQKFKSKQKNNLYYLQIYINIQFIHLIFENELIVQKKENTINLYKII